MERNEQVALTSLRRGTGLRAGYVYAKLVNKTTGLVVVNATLDYCLRAILYNGLILSNPEILAEIVLQASLPTEWKAK